MSLTARAEQARASSSRASSSSLPQQQHEQYPSGGGGGRSLLALGDNIMVPLDMDGANFLAGAREAFARVRSLRAWVGTPPVPDTPGPEASP